MGTLGYLEGDERFHVDGLATPQWYGTGTEDLYEGGWYFNRGPFTNPMNGAPAAEAAGMYGCEIQCDAAYRLLIGDAIDFQQGITTGVEPGPESNHAAHYSSTAFWYGHETPAARITDTVEVGDEASEAAHAYSGGGDARELTSVFEGDHDDVEVTDTVRDADGTVRFTLAIDEDATGVRLVRRADQAEAGQAAEVRIDRRKVGIWSAPLGNEHQRWVEDSFDLPRKVTRGKQEIIVEITPLDGKPSWTAARYQALSTGTPEHG